MAWRYLLRRDTATNWSSVNPVLALGEPGFDETAKQLKMGDGVTAWADLAYATDVAGGAAAAQAAAEAYADGKVSAEVTRADGTYVAAAGLDAATAAVVTPGGSQTAAAIAADPALRAAIDAEGTAKGWGSGGVTSVVGQTGGVTGTQIAGDPALQSAYVGLGKVAQTARQVPGFSGPYQPSPGQAIVTPTLSSSNTAPATANPTTFPLPVTPNTTIQGPLMADPAIFHGSVAYGVNGSGQVSSIQPHGTTGPPAIVEWVTDSPLFALMLSLTTTSFYLWVNGELVFTQSSSPWGNPYGYIDWAGVRQMRHYVLMTNNGLFLSGFAADKADTFYAPTHRRRVKVGWLGDSYSQGVGGLPWQVGRLLGWDIQLLSTDGGTGYITDNGTAQRFSNRTGDIVAANPDVVVVAGGINDPLTGLQTGATSVLQDLRDGLPNVPIFVVGPWTPPGSPYSAQSAKYTAIQAAAAAVSGCTFIDPHTWWTGTGNTGSRVVTDGVTTASSAVITSATAAFVSGDVGSFITGAGIPASTKILSVQSSTQATLTANATVTATGVSLTITNQKGDGNTDIYINPDNTHPNPPGYNYLAARLASAILAKMPY